MNETAGRVKTYVLRSGRMTCAQRRFYGEPASLWRLPAEGPPLDLAAVFDNGNPVIAEIGFGTGEATAAIAEANPGKNYLGIEVYKSGIGRLLWKIERRGLKNVRIIEGDAVEVLERRLPAASLAGLHIFFPDPWPKKRHHKRRLLTRPVTSLLASCLSPGGYLYAVTDWAEYAGWALAELSATPGLQNPHPGFAPPQPWRPKTKFETKGLLKKHEIREIYFLKSTAPDDAGDARVAGRTLRATPRRVV